MSSNEGPPPGAKYRMPARVAAVGVAYAIYLIVQGGTGRVAAPLLIAAGVLLLAWTEIDRFTIRRVDRSGMMQAGTYVLGFGLVATGLIAILT